MCNLLTYSLPHESDILSSSSITLRTNELSFHEIIPARPNDITTFGNLTLEFCKSLQVPNPSYVQGTYFTTYIPSYLFTSFATKVLCDKLLSVTSFSLLRKGEIIQYDLNNFNIPKVTGRKLKGDYLWPNELTIFNDSTGNDVLIVPDGFLLPGQNDGALYAIKDPNNPSAQPIRITERRKGWFYHRATHVKLPGGVSGILTARANKPLLGAGKGELVWLTMPKNFNSDNPAQEPWVETILVEGPDVMFEVVDLDKDDNTIEVVAAHFFEQKLSVHSIQSSDTYPYVSISDTVILDCIGRPYGLCVANMNNNINDKPTHILVSTHECSYDIPSAVDMALSAVNGIFPRIKTGRFKGIRGGERLPLESGLISNDVEKGGSLFAYALPPKNNNSKWSRQTLFRGFKVRGWGGIFSPGAPGFPYVFHMPEQLPTSPPIILLAGDCTGSAYIFSPTLPEGECNKALAPYELAFEIECGATVGSAAFQEITDEDGSKSIELYVPSYELNKIHVFQLSNSRINPAKYHEIGGVLEKNNAKNRLLKL